MMRPLRFVCDSCRHNQHEDCDNIERTGRADATWCDCGHREQAPAKFTS